ncbi:MAG TPA: protease modulator HflC [Spirochaetales bacterium]|nr:protease modulator HflC [Spirochaetales bacterium]HRY54731.1 protease modulator HflC [Spirochaetia bacterium]HRZ64986.1 protease modulator HflC [Spirochaetia bacterium]
MKKLIIGIVVALALFAAFLAMGPFYVLNEGEQAVVVRLGKIVSVQSEAGLKMRSPFLDAVVRYPKRLMPWDGEPQRIPTKENQFIWVDATARWRIVDPTRFYESMSSIENAYGRLDDVIDSAVRTVVSSNYLREAVRNSNALVGSGTKESFQTGDAEGSAALDQLTQTEVSHDKIEKGRRRLSADMLDIVKAIAPQYGIEVLDIIPRQIKYSDELTESVYNRMIKERNQIAQAFRSYGEGKKAEWLGKLENEKRTVLSEAYAKAEAAKGKADAEASRVYAAAYGRDPSFYDFWRAVESYRQTLPSFSKTLSTDLDYFRYLYGPRGR